MPIRVMRPAEGGKLVICDRKLACPYGSTCCKNNDNKWMCCPHPQAVCCSDNLHCCPMHTKCVRQGFKCKSANYLFSSATLLPMNPLLPKQTLKPLQVKKNTNICPGKHFRCPVRSTCCKLYQRTYGCCPLPKAVCCSDGIHCCPNGYTCDVSAGTCSKGSERILLLQKKLAKPVSDRSGIVVCPGGQFYCPDKNTYCRLPSGQCGCCPLPNAVCCSDGIHCCPNGYTCNVSAGTCIKGSEKIRLLQKQPAKPVNVKSGVIICPGGQAECPNGNTCCRLPSGHYGCCPLPKAVCCSDGIHCCPNGYTCNVPAGTCSKGSEKIQLLQKQPAKPVNVKSGIVVCPGGQAECPNGNTCCRLPSGKYGCCPLPKAVCCSDGIHCCPSGYTCDVSAGICTKGSEKIGLPRKQLANPSKVTPGFFVCPDGQSECPVGKICCKLTSRQYGCCVHTSHLHRTNWGHLKNEFKDFLQRKPSGGFYLVRQFP